MKPVIVLFFFIFLTGCEIPVSADLDQEFNLKVGRQAFIEEENLKIFFLTVSEDSRCPVGLNCFWSGNGKVVLEIKQDFNSSLDTLNTHLDPGSAYFQNYKIVLKNLEPYPVEENPIEPKEYTATLIVKKAAAEIE